MYKSDGKIIETIEEAFETYDTLEIEYLKGDYCDLCEEETYNYEYEYSFVGTKEDFEKHIRKNDYCLNLNDEVEYSHDNIFRYYETIGYNRERHNPCTRCKACSDKLIALKNSEYIKATMNKEYGTDEFYPTFETTETEYTEVEKRQ